MVYIIIADLLIYFAIKAEFAIKRVECVGVERFNSVWVEKEEFGSGAVEIFGRGVKIHGKGGTVGGVDRSEFVDGEGFFGKGLIHSGLVEIAGVCGGVGAVELEGCSERD